MSFNDDDEVLVARALNGSPRAWQNLVKRYERQIYNYGLRLTGNRSDAMDLMQEVFMGVYRNLHRFRGDARFTSWLFRIAHNKSVDMNRRRRPVSFQDNGDEDGSYENQPDEAAVNPETDLLTHEANHEISAVLAELNFEQRLLIELKIYQSRTFDEIAEMQDVPVNTVKTRFYSALRKLKRLMEEEHVV